MNTATKSDVTLEEIYDESGHWHVNTGGETIHAKRMGGHFRNLKWLSMSTWLVFFFGSYLRWGDRQAVLFDIPARKFHIFGASIMPQDVWLLALVLLFFAISLAAVTSVAGRVFCGYFCFQTIWTDIFTWIETKLEGNPSKRRKLDAAPLSLKKLRIKIIKHTAWLLIGLFTGISFVAWFTDAYQLWADLFSFNIPLFEGVLLFAFTFGTYILAGFMREQTCFWLCPYARIQGVMYDNATILPTYDVARGEPRGKLKKGGVVEGNGDCISCNQCVAVCPTGIDIRMGQQEGCITCGLCLDACDQVMDKIGRPRGLIRYSSLDELNGQTLPPVYKRPRILIYAGIIAFAAFGLIYGLSNLGSMDLKIIHARQPLFVQQSNGDIQNKYQLKVLNKTDKDMTVSITVVGLKKFTTNGLKERVRLPAGKLSSFTVFVRAPKSVLEKERTALTFTIHSFEVYEDTAEYESMFYGPRF